MIKESTILNPQVPENKPPAESFSGEKEEFRNKKLEKADYSDTGKNNLEEKEENSKKSIDNSKEKEINEERAKEVMERILNDYEKLKKLKGKHGADQLFSQILDSVPKEKILQASEYMSDLNEAREKAFNKLKEIGIIQKAPQGGLIYDVDGFKNLDSGFIESLGSVYSSKYMGKRSTRRALDLLFEDEKVISREDYENSREKKFKNLFYSPKTKEEALDIEKIKDSKFYLTFNDVMSKINDNKFGYGNIPKEDLSFKEVLLPVLIYHPQYGAGYRDSETNKLMVKNEKGEYRVFSGQYLIDKFGVRGKKNLAISRDYLKNELPNLLENGILNSEDFRRQRFISEEVESYRAFRKISRRGMVMFNKIRYTLGSDFDPKKGNFEACKISSDIGGVVKTSEDGKKEIVATFKILEEEEANKTEKGYLTVGVKQADIRKYVKEDIYFRRPEESDEDYHKRIKDYEDFNLIIEVSDYISQETGINIANFNFKEQQMISALAKKTNYEKDPRINYRLVILLFFPSRERKAEKNSVR
jgi:hypothetical protein